jgi:hypothetical protein
MAQDVAENQQIQHRSGQHFEPGMKELLDHIAVELATEYVRLMKATASASEHAPTHSD